LKFRVDTGSTLKAYSSGLEGNTVFSQLELAFRISLQFICRLSHPAWKEIQFLASLSWLFVSACNSFAGYRRSIEGVAMSEYIPVTCPVCGHQWHEDLDKAQAQRVIFRGEKKTRVEIYVFTCPKDGTQVAVEVEREV
jgi:hypothetical protein